MILNFAHRGSLTEAPENTLPAMEKAIQHNVGAIELDVQLTKDNHLIVVHDQNFSRYNKNTAGLIKDYTLEEIKKVDVGSVFSNSYQGVTLATLEEVLDMLPEDILLNIEIKNSPFVHEGIENILVNCLLDYNRLGNVLISSFDHDSLKTVRKLAPNVKLGLLLNHKLFKPWVYARNLELNLTSIHPNVKQTNKKLIRESHSLGYKVYPYTVNKVKTYNRLVNIGVDGVFSNNPEIFAKSINNNQDRVIKIS
ncbi:glycerophosphodiester phosphodiesterase [Virgibacillus phasianinus]|uniref:Glycerophosphodiester phosphodiesterase n=1 Tax=Virgibacillus phasianinus TaxID=2017483 RepID=A0A220U221_9BACI|nr:glycerophosphodiester phosphodiesterase family protein [Virgibacillus phasianinus]ASK62169.1 glycerophosphodiester phosphodiesterase [Virgibacillus phasianinus]